MRSLNDPEPSAASRAPEPTPSANFSEPQKNLVMVVAQSPVNRIVVTRIVERAGIKVLAVEPGEAAAALEDRRPALVVLDTDSTHGDAHPLINVIRAHKSSASGLPLAILLTQRGNGHERDPCFDAVVTKPITPETLQPVVERLLMDGERPAQGVEAARA